MAPGSIAVRLRGVAGRRVAAAGCVGATATGCWSVRLGWRYSALRCRWRCWRWNSAERNPFAKLELLPFAFSLCSVGFLYGLFDRRPEEMGAIDRHAAVEGMDEGWIVLDVNDTIMDMNAAAERMTGYARGRLRATDLVPAGRSLQPGADTEQEPGSGDEAQHPTGGGLALPEHPHLHADGSRTNADRPADTVAGHDRDASTARMPDSAPGTRCSCC